MDPPRRVVVCGGGVIGACTAYFLSKRGAAVTLVEKSSIACAASGKAAGFLALDWSDGGPMSSLARASFNLHRTLAEELNGSDLYAYRPVTTLSVTVAATTSSDKCPNLPAWVDGPAKWQRTIGTTETTAQVHPKMFTETLVSKAVEEYGLKVVIGKLETVEVAEGAATAVVLEDGGVIECDAVVLALGPWSEKLSLLGSIFKVSGAGIKVHSVVLEPKDGCGITPHVLCLTYCPVQGGNPIDPELHPRSTGEVYICGMWSDAELPDDPKQIMPTPESIRALKDAAKIVSSHLVEGEATVKAEQACFLPCTEDNLPVIGQVPGVKGCYVATGHSGWGILNGPATGIVVSELVLDGRATLVDLAPFSPARFLDAK